MQVASGSEGEGMARSPSSLGTLLAGHLALVTGGGSGIGRAVSAALAREGARIVVADVNTEAAADTQQTLPGQHEHQSLEVDVGESESVSRLFDRIHKLYSRAPSVVVNCAGITKDSFLLDMTESMFDDVIKINLKGTYLINQAAAKHMVANNVKNGSIINISSIVGKTGNKGQCNYAASKAGVVGFTKTAALELAKFGIRCNAIMPGFIDTPMVATVPDKVMQKVLSGIPLGRKGSAEEIADVCTFLASKNSSYITGAVLEVTGGLSM